MSDLMIMYDYYMTMAENSADENEHKMYKWIAGAVEREIENMIEG